MGASSKEESGRVTRNACKCPILYLSSSTFNEWASAPLNARSQQDLLLCKYAPRPEILPVGSMIISFGVQTTLINDLFGDT